MKIASFYRDKPNLPQYGIIVDDKILIPEKGFLARYPTLRDVIEANKIDQLESACQLAKPLPFNQVIFLPPIPNARRVICAGMNYKKVYPVDMEAPPLPENVMLFAKLEGTLVGHKQELELPSGEAGKTYDYEGELVCIIGKGGRHIPAEKALEHIAGFTIMNDGSVRGWQKQSLHAGKNFANSGSCGPWMVTRDSFDNIDDIRIQTRLNGITVQSAYVREMLFSIEKLISYISGSTHLKPGDMISTGSPDGSGGSRNPTRFLSNGDCLEIDITGIGVLTNPVCSGINIL